MEAFRAVNFAVFPHRGVLGSGESRKSMEEMVRRIHTNWVIFTPSGMQETPYSEEIRYDGEKSCTDEELYDMIRYAQSLGLNLANPNGATGSRVTLPFRNIMHRLRSGQAVNCSWRGAK